VLLLGEHGVTERHEVLQMGVSLVGQGN